MNEVIKKLVLQLGDKEVELTLDEAKKLHEALNEMFEQKVVTVERHHYGYPWRWTPYWYSDTYTVTPTITPITPTTSPIWYSSTGAAQASMSSNSTLNVKLMN